MTSSNGSVSRRRYIVDQKTGVALGIVFLIAGASFTGGTVYSSAPSDTRAAIKESSDQTLAAVAKMNAEFREQLATMSNEIRDIRFEQKAQAADYHRSLSDRWYGQDMRLFVSELARFNPALIVPDVNEMINRHKK